MPRIILPDGTVKYYETEEQLEEELQQVQPAAPTITQQPKPAPTQASKPAPAKPKQAPPSWWEETLRTLSTMAVQVPTKIVEGVQALGQAVPPSALGTPMGGDPLGGLYVKAGGKPEQMQQIAEKDVELAKRGQRATSLGISIPTEKGEVYKLGIPKEAPGGSLLSEEGEAFKAIKPRTALGQGLADVGSAIVMSFALPNFGGTQGANLATLRNVIKPSFRNSLRGGLELAKRVGADLPQDFVEELLFFAAPEPSEEEQRLVDQMISTKDPKVKKAMAEMLLADDDETVKFYNKWLINALGNTAASAVIRGNLGVLNQARRATAAAKLKGKKLKLEELEKGAEPVLKQIQDVVEADTTALRQRLEMDEVSELNSQFTSTVRNNIELLSNRVRGLSQADLATQKAVAEGETAVTELTSLSAQAVESTNEINRLSGLIKARSASIKEMDKLEAQKPGYLTGANKTKYNRYQKQLLSYKDQLEVVSKGIEERSSAFDVAQQQAGMASAQFESLGAARRSSIDAFINELEPWFNNLETINNRRAQLAPDMSMSDDPYYQSYQRIKEAYDNYKLYGGKETAAGADIDPSQEQVRLAFEGRLFDTIQQEFDRLQEEAGGSGPIEVDPAVYEAAQKLNEAPAGAAEEAVTAAEAVPPDKAVEAVEGAPAAPSAAPKEPGTKMPDPWTMTDQVPLTMDDTGNVVPDPDFIRAPGITEDIPTNREARIRQAQVDLGLRNPDQVEEIVDDIKRFTTEEAVDDYIRYSNEIAELEARSPDGVSYDWDRDSTKALERVVGNYDTQSARKMAILQALKRKGGKIENYTPKALERVYKIAGKYANAENDFVLLFDILNKAGLKRQKVIKGVEDAHVEVFATAIELQIGSNRLLKVVDALTTQADSLTPSEAQTYRSIAAQEGLLLYQSVGDFMTLRNRASSLLASFKQGILGKVQDMFGKVSQKKRQGLDADQLIENYVKDIQKFQAELANQISDDVGNYIGLPSNLRNVEDILNKFRDPDLNPDENDLALFNKIISKLTVAGANPEALGSLMLTGDEIVQRQMKAAGLSNIKTQTSFPPQTAIYGAGFWLDGLTTGKINKLWSSIPWLRDDEATQFAVGQERIYRTMMEQDFTQMAGNIASWVYRSRQFNRSIITDAITPLDNSGKFEADVRVKDPIRESQLLGIINNPEGVSDKGIMGAFKRVLGEERAQKLRNHTFANWVQFHDQFWLGDAYKELPNTLMGNYAKKRYEFSPQGLFDRFLAPLTKGAVTPFESKLASGERLGGSLPLSASEISTEYIGGLFANLYARAKAQIEVEDMVDAAGRPLYVKGTDGFNAAVDKKYYEEYLRPVSVGVGEKAEDIAYAVADRDAQYLALAMDMMMPMEDDAWKGMYERLKSRGADGDINWFTTFLTPYIKTPLNAHKHHFYYTQPLPGTPVPTGVGLEALVGLRRFLDKSPDADKMATSILGFQSKLFSKDPATRARARSGLTLSTAMNVGVLSLVESNALEITGGQRDQYQEANGAYIPMYSIKIGGQWVPYRWLPYVGELLAYAANFRDFRKNASDSDSMNVVGTAIMAMGATLMDTPALAGIDTIISILEKPKDAEYFILDFAERVGGVRFPGLRQGILRATNEAYGARPVLSGEGAGVVAVKEPDPRLGEELSYWDQWSEGVKDVLAIGKFVGQGAALFANRLGILPAVEAMDGWLSDNNLKAVKQGDYRQAHWYKPGDVKYTGPTQASVMTTFLGRHWPVPNASDVVDMELFRHGIKPPGQVFQGKYGIVANDVMINRFRRYLGSEYRDDSGRSVYQTFKDLVENKTPIPGTENVYYKDLIDDPKNSLTLDAKQAPYIDTTDQMTKRMALMELRSAMIRDAAEQFLNNGIEVVDENGKVSVKPITYGAPIEAQKAYQNYQKAKTEQTILKLIY